MNANSFFNHEPPSAEMVLPNLPVGSVGSLLGPPGSGKTLFALELCCAVACSAPEEANLLDLPVRTSGLACYLNAEDPEVDIHRVVHSIGTHLSAPARKTIDRNMVIDIGFGVPQDLSDPECRNSIIKLCRNAKLIVFDTLSRFHTFDESHRNSTARLVGLLEQIARETGAAVLCLDQPNPESHLSERMRWRAKLKLMKEEESRFLTDEEGETGRPLSQKRDMIEVYRHFTEFWTTDPFFSNLGTVNWFRFTDKGILVPAKLYATELTTG